MCEDIPTVRFKSDQRDASRKGGPASWDRGLSYGGNRDRPTNFDQIGQLAFFVESFHAIAARSPCDRGLIEPRSWLNRGAIVAQDQLALVTHDRHAIVAINWLLTGSNGPDFSREFPLKPMISLLCNSTLD